MWVIIEYCPHGNLLDFLRKRREIFEATWTTPTEHADETFTTIDLYICALQVARAMEFLTSRRVSLSRSSYVHACVSAKWPVKISFCSMRRPGIFLLNPRVPPNIKIAGTQLYSQGNEALCFVVLPKNTTLCPWPGLKPGPLDLLVSVQTMRPQRLHPSVYMIDPIKTIF